MQDSSADYTMFYRELANCVPLALTSSSDQFVSECLEDKHLGKSFYKPLSGKDVDEWKKWLLYYQTLLLKQNKKGTK